MSLALSSWEGIIESEDLEKVDDIAPLMSVFGYKPQVQKGEYDQFKSQVSKYDLFKSLLEAEIEYNYKPRYRKTAVKTRQSKRKDYRVDMEFFAKSKARYEL